jgi:hypothetical protein
MPLKYSATPAISAGSETAATPPVQSVTPTSQAGGTAFTAETTREALFNPDGSPKPIRNLGALRKKLAGKGGVNPAESQVPDTALEPRTEETEDGGARPIGQLPETPTTKRTRRTPAQMAEAKAVVEAAKAALAVGAGAAPVAAGSAALSVRDFSTDDLLAELYRRLRGAP